MSPARKDRIVKARNESKETNFMTVPCRAVRCDRTIRRAIHGPEGTLDASWMVFYHQSGLGSGNHTMRVTNTSFLGQTLNVDYVAVVQSL